MSEVRMSLAEYDNLKEKIRKYEGILKELTTPFIDNWDIKYFREHPGSTLQVCSESLSKESIEFLKDLVIENVENSTELYKTYGEWEPEFCIDRLLLFRVPSESIFVEDVTVDIEEA